MLRALRRRGSFRRTAFILAVLLAAASISPTYSPPVAAQGTERAEAVVLVNSHSARYGDFASRIRPYLDHLGIPYTVIDIASNPLHADIAAYAVIVIGHRQLDIAGSALDATEQGYLVDAVIQGSGLVNFDGDIAEGGIGRYLFVDSLFGFVYKTPAVDYGVAFPIESGTLGTVIECTDDAHQDPVLPTQPQNTTINVTDGQWTEMFYPPRPEPALLAGLSEEGLGLPVMHCFADGLANGQYEVWANLYTGVFGDNLTYYYGYNAGSPKQYAVDTVGRSGGEDRFGEHNLGTVIISDGTFDIYFRDADARAIPGMAADRAALAGLYAQEPGATTAQPTYFGWSSIRLVPSGTPAPTMPWISERHDPTEWIGTGSLEMSGINTMGPAAAVVAQSSSEPLLVATTTGAGRAVHWASYDWVSYNVKGPMYGLDDLVWRSIVWAARKPFVLQGLPPFVTMRVDDAVGPFDWIQTANTYGLKPWVGLFYQQVDEASAAQLTSLTGTGMATTSVHAKNQDVTTTGVFYYEHGLGDLPDATVQTNFANAAAWFTSHNIPMARFVIPQFYEFGTNVFDDLQGWGVEFVSTAIEPGSNYGDPWINNGPFRLYETRNSDTGHPFYYADYVDVPGHPEFANEFFNCGTEIRDDAGFEWFPNGDVVGTIGRGTRQLERALDAMALPVLFTHEPYLHAIGTANLGSILQGIASDLSAYNVEGVTMDQACQYVRAMHNSDIDTAVYNPGTTLLTVNLVGQTDMPTRLYLFTDDTGVIQQQMVDVPQFSGSLPLTIHLGQSFPIYLPVVMKRQAQ